MNLGEAKKKALQLMNEYSNNGTLISATNNADYTLRMNTLAHSAQMEIAAVKKIHEVYEIEQIALTADDPDYKSFIRYTMPDDFIKAKQIVYEADGEYQIQTNVRWEGRKTLVLPSHLSGTFIVEYYKYPTEILTTTDDSFLFELEPDACELIPYYIGAHVTMDEPDKQGVSSMLMNLYQGKLANLDVSEPKRFEKIVRVNGW